MRYATLGAKRRQIGFPGDPLDFALIDFGADHHLLAPQLVEEAPMGGGSLAVRAGDDNLVDGRGCRANVGRIEPVPAEIRWARTLDDRETRVEVPCLG